MSVMQVGALVVAVVMFVAGVSFVMTVLRGRR